MPLQIKSKSIIRLASHLQLWPVIINHRWVCFVILQEFSQSLVNYDSWVRDVFVFRNTSTFLQKIIQPFTKPLSTLPQHSAEKCFQSFNYVLYFFTLLLNLVVFGITSLFYWKRHSSAVHNPTLFTKLKSTSLFNLNLYWSYFSCSTTFSILFCFVILLHPFSEEGTRTI